MAEARQERGSGAAESQSRKARPCSVPCFPRINDLNAFRIEGAGIACRNGETMGGCDGGDIAVRRGKALAYISGSNGKVGIMSGGIEGEDSALEQRKHPLERGGELPRDRVKLRV